MHILDLPSELIENILYHSILSRAINRQLFPRALRLKLVCKTFCVAFRPALFRSKALDNAGQPDTFQDWHIRRYHGADTLCHDYLLFRCRYGTDRTVGRSVDLRNVAHAYLLHCNKQEAFRALDCDAVLDGLCWLALERGNRCPGQQEGWASHIMRKNEPSNPGLNLLAAATYFGCASLVTDLLHKGYDPTLDSNLFPSAMYLAAWSGQADMLQLLQEHLPAFEDTEPSREHGCFGSKLGAGSLSGAAARGDMRMVQMALHPPSRTIQVPDDKEMGSEEGNAPNSMLARGMKPGSVPLQSKLGYYIAQAMSLARCPEVYSYLESFLPSGTVSSQTRDQHLAVMASAGNLTMVRHLLDLGGNPSASGTFGGTPLLLAVRSWQEDVVELLLSRGADPSARGWIRHGTPLTAAARAGSTRLLRRLLDAGAVIQATHRDVWTLHMAVKTEHTAMVELLLDMGLWRDKAKRYSLQLALDLGLESMVDLLKSRGVSLEKTADQKLELDDHAGRGS